MSDSNIRGVNSPSITLNSDIAYFAIRQELLSESIFRIALETVLASVLTRSPSKMDWEDQYESGPRL